MDKWATQQGFWASFGIPAYDEQTVFTEGKAPALPHITYQSFGGNLGQTATLSASLWYPGPSWAEIKKKADEIQKYIVEHSPLAIRMDGGYLWVKVPSLTPFAQPMEGTYDDTKRIVNRMVLTVEAESLSAY